MFNERLCCPRLTLLCQWQHPLGTGRLLYEYRQTGALGKVWPCWDCVPGSNCLCVGVCVHVLVHSSYCLLCQDSCSAAGIQNGGSMLWHWWIDGRYAVVQRDSGPSEWRETDRKVRRLEERRHSKTQIIREWVHCPYTRKQIDEQYKKQRWDEGQTGGIKNSNRKRQSQTKVRGCRGVNERGKATAYESKWVGKTEGKCVWGGGIFFTYFLPLIALPCWGHRHPVWHSQQEALNLHCLRILEVCLEACSSGVCACVCLYCLCVYYMDVCDCRNPLREAHALGHLDWVSCILSDLCMHSATTETLYTITLALQWLLMGKITSPWTQSQHDIQIILHRRKQY